MEMKPTDEDFELAQRWAHDFLDDDSPVTFKRLSQYLAPLIDQVREEEREKTKQAVDALALSQAKLIKTTGILGEAEAMGPHSLPYKLKDLKIGVDLQLIANARTLKELGHEV